MLAVSQKVDHLTSPSAEKHMQKLHILFSHVGKRLQSAASRMTKSAFSDAHRLLVGAIASARREAGLKQEDVAATLGKHQSYVSNIERGQRRIDVVEFYMLARAMNIEPTLLFERAVKGFPAKVEV